MQSRGRPIRIAFVFGTRPECIKLAPVIRAVEAHPDMESVVICSSQHTDLLQPFLRCFDIRIDHDLQVMREGQTPDQVLAHALIGLGDFFAGQQFDLVIVQGDTATALAGALAAFHAHIPVGHVEAGLRTGNIHAPFPEEMNRRLITQLATLHFAATKQNVETLLGEGVDSSVIWKTGNPVVDALHWILKNEQPSQTLSDLVSKHSDKKLITLTTHRRESFGETMLSNLRALTDYVQSDQDALIVFPVHPNPNVRRAAKEALDGANRIEIIDPLGYADFIHLLRRSWLIVSDSGGVQEEAPALAKRLIVLRQSTERPEVVACGVAKLIGNDPKQLKETLMNADNDADWTKAAEGNRDLYGTGDAGEKIVTAIADHFGLECGELLRTTA